MDLNLARIEASLARGDLLDRRTAEALVARVRALEAVSADDEIVALTSAGVRTERVEMAGV